MPSNGTGVQDSLVYLPTVAGLLEGQPDLKFGLISTLLALFF